MRTREEILMDWAEFKIREMPDFYPHESWGVADIPGLVGKYYCGRGQKWEKKLWSIIIELLKSCNKEDVRIDIDQLTQEFCIFCFRDATGGDLHGPGGQKIKGSDWCY